MRSQTCFRDSKKKKKTRNVTKLLTIQEDDEDLYNDN